MQSKLFLIFFLALKSGFCIYYWIYIWESSVAIALAILFIFLMKNQVERGKA